MNALADPVARFAWDSVAQGRSPRAVFDELPPGSIVATAKELELALRAHRDWADAWFAFSAARNHDVPTWSLSESETDGRPDGKYRVRYTPTTTESAEPKERLFADPVVAAANFAKGYLTALADRISGQQSRIAALRASGPVYLTASPEVQFGGVSVTPVVVLFYPAGIELRIGRFTGKAILRTDVESVTAKADPPALFVAHSAPQFASPIRVIAKPDTPIWNAVERSLSPSPN